MHAHTYNLIRYVLAMPSHPCRCILAARCETFRRMFNSSMRESDKGQKVEVAEATHAAFFCMLQVRAV